MKKSFYEIEFIQSCRLHLLQMKQDLLNRQHHSKKLILNGDRNFTGDEIDQTVAQLEENALLISQERIRHQLLEIELALARIENGSFGICEETEEPIERERLQALPQTRLSIEGAELREAISRRFAK